jgi:hypothetical protein
MSFAEHVPCKEGAEVSNGEIRQGGVQTREVGDAQAKAWNAEKRIGTPRQEQETGDRDRPQRSTAERRQGTAALVAKTVSRETEEILTADA